jgi:hypothetical protein
VEDRPRRMSLIQLNYLLERRNNVYCLQAFGCSGGLGGQAKELYRPVYKMINTTFLTQTSDLDLSTILNLDYDFLNSFICSSSLSIIEHKYFEQEVYGHLVEGQLLRSWSLQYI